MRDTSSRWHAEAHRWIRTNGTLGQSVRYLGSRGSRVNWTPQVRKHGKWVPDNDPFAHHFVDTLITFDQVRAIELLEGIGVFYAVIECDAAHGLRWNVYSPSELRWPYAGRAAHRHVAVRRTEAAVARRHAGQPATRAPPRVAARSRMVLRAVVACCRRAPAPRGTALMVLAEQALDTSRLAGAGILFVPNSIAFPDQLGVDEARDVTKSPTFRRLARALIEPIGDRSNTDAVIPVVLTGPDDAGEKIKHLLLERKDDPEGWAKRRDSHLREIARAMDLPAGRVLNNDDQAKFANSRAMSDEVVEVYLPRFCDEIAKAISDACTGRCSTAGESRTSTSAASPRLLGTHPDEDRTSEGLQLREAGVLSRKGLAKLARPVRRRLHAGRQRRVPAVGCRAAVPWPCPAAGRADAPSDWGALPPAAAARILDAVEPPRLASPTSAVSSRPESLRWRPTLHASPLRALLRWTSKPLHSHAQLHRPRSASDSRSSATRPSRPARR